MRKAWSQLSGVQRVRSPGIRRCWDQCCPCQIIWGSTGKHRADRASTSGGNAQQQGCTFIFHPGLCHSVCYQPPTSLTEVTYHLSVHFVDEQHKAALRPDFYCHGGASRLGLEVNKSLPALKSVTSINEVKALSSSRVWPKNIVFIKRSNFYGSSCKRTAFFPKFYEKCDIKIQPALAEWFWKKNMWKSHVCFATQQFLIRTFSFFLRLR